MCFFKSCHAIAQSVSGKGTSCKKEIVKNVYNDASKNAKDKTDMNVNKQGKGKEKGKGKGEEKMNKK